MSNFPHGLKNPADQNIQSAGFFNPWEVKQEKRNLLSHVILQESFDY
jgi:hypothetical protein